MFSKEEKHVSLIEDPENLEDLNNIVSDNLSEERIITYCNTNVEEPIIKENSYNLPENIQIACCNNNSLTKLITDDAIINTPEYNELSIENEKKDKLNDDLTDLKYSNTCFLNNQKGDNVMFDGTKSSSDKLIVKIEQPQHISLPLDKPINQYCIQNNTAAGDKLSNELIHISNNTEVTDKIDINFPTKNVIDKNNKFVDSQADSKLSPSKQNSNIKIKTSNSLNSSSKKDKSSIITRKYSNDKNSNNTSKLNSNTNSPVTKLLRANSNKSNLSESNKSSKSNLIKSIKSKNKETIEKIDKKEKSKQPLKIISVSATQQKSALNYFSNKNVKIVIFFIVYILYFWCWGKRRVSIYIKI